MPTSRVHLIALPLIALLAVGGMITILLNRNNNIQNSSNTTTFYQWSSCYTKLSQLTCDDIQDDETEKALCYTSAYQVGQYTYDQSENILDECKNFQSFSKSAETSDMINNGDHYYNCYLSGEVLSGAYQSQFYYTKIYTPLYITCAGY